MQCGQRSFGSWGFRLHLLDGEVQGEFENWRGTTGIPE